jgi:hypothetical protein
VDINIIFIKNAARQMPTWAEQDGRRAKLGVLFLSTAHNHRDSRYELPSAEGFTRVDAKFPLAWVCQGNNKNPKYPK